MTQEQENKPLTSTTNPCPQTSSVSGTELVEVQQLPPFVSSCPQTCPNRQRKGQIGAGYVFSAIVSLFLGVQSVSVSYQLHPDKTQNFAIATQLPSQHILVFGLTLIGLGLGIEIDKSAVSKGIEYLLKNSNSV